MQSNASELTEMAMIPEIRAVEIDRPWMWLAAGWRDFSRAPMVSLCYGFIFSVAGYVVIYGLYAVDQFYLILPLAAGFTLVGPVAAVGLYDVSRRLESGQPVTLGAALRSFLSHAGTISAMGLVLMLFLLAWIRIALLIFALFFGGKAIPPGNFIEVVFFAPESLPFVIIGTVVGAILATSVFAISAISLPMLLDRNVGVPTAVVASFRAVNKNPQAMALWAALIAGFTAFGIATLFVGLTVCLPLVGYASWHAYRDLIGEEGTVSL
ncbi:MAG: DUF2189 domain-containing protein [Alphaproteobacteria bacterium]|nr:DUF2189 domain-containing protein [Alphaproteobacteria bacterium]